MPFPLPPLAEQQRIVAEVERHMSVIQAAEAVVEANLKRAERLRQAILKRAFEGKLVPQDPSDEPASALLERIRGERAQATDAVKRLEAFCQRVSQGLEHLAFEEKQKLLRLLIDRIVIEGEKVQIYGIIPLDGYGEVISLRPRHSGRQPTLYPAGRTAKGVQGPAR